MEQYAIVAADNCLPIIVCEVIMSENKVKSLILERGLFVFEKASLNKSECDQDYYNSPAYLELRERAILDGFPPSSVIYVGKSDGSICYVYI